MFYILDINFDFWMIINRVLLWELIIMGEIGLYIKIDFGFIIL